MGENTLQRLGDETPVIMHRNDNDGDIGAEPEHYEALFAYAQKRLDKCEKS